MRVFVLGINKEPLMPCHPARARKLLKTGRAAIYRMVPFTIILDLVTGDVQHVDLRVDPGSRVTGVALVGRNPSGDRVIWAGEIAHRGVEIKKALADRRSLRRGRRQRKTRYRKARFNNRRRSPDLSMGVWLPPSLRSRVDNVGALSRRLMGICPMSAIQVETVRFDMQALQNPEIRGVEYQQGTLAGYELREYLLEKFNRTCAYCGAPNIPLEIEHIKAKSIGGSDRVSNLTLACRPCNQAKGNLPIEVFLAKKPALLKKITALAKAPLKDAAAVNSTRYAVGRVLQVSGLPVTFWSGGRTKHNRISRGYPKAHWLDAACVGERGNQVHAGNMRVLEIKAKGRGKRQVKLTDRYGFPRKAKSRTFKRKHGFQCGDLVELVQPKGKYQGRHVGHLAGIRERGDFDIHTIKGKAGASWKRFRLIQKYDGYHYNARQAFTAAGHESRPERGVVCATVLCSKPGRNPHRRVDQRPC